MILFQFLCERVETDYWPKRSIAFVNLLEFVELWPLVKLFFAYETLLCFLIQIYFESFVFDVFFMYVVGFLAVGLYAESSKKLFIFLVYYLVSIITVSLLLSVGSIITSLFL